jgi:hypothetical protein
MTQGKDQNKATSAGKVPPAAATPSKDSTLCTEHKKDKALCTGQPHVTSVTEQHKK